MTLLESLHEKRRLFHQSIAAKAVPDHGIDLRRRVNPIKIERGADEAFGPIMPSIEDLAFGPIVAPAEKQAPNWRPKIEDIQRVVAREFNVARIELLSSRRSLNVVLPRQVAMYLAKTLTVQSLPQIGRRFGGRDHTTVLHAVRKVEAMRSVNADLDGRIRKLIDIIHPGFVASAYSQPEGATCNSTATTAI